MSLQLWLARPGEIEETAARTALLEPYERAAQTRLLDPSKGHEYFVTRLLARAALGHVLGEDPAALRFERSAHGKPALQMRSPVRFNLSNTRGLVVCLIGEGGEGGDGAELGVDVEEKSRGDAIVALAKTVFAPRELAVLEALPRREREHHAAQLWTLKESYIKARGKGMALPLEAFSFRVGAEIELELEPVMADRSERWFFQTLELGEHIVSLCVERAASGLWPTVQIRDLQTIL